MGKYWYNRSFFLSLTYFVIDVNRGDLSRGMVLHVVQAHHATIFLHNVNYSLGYPALIESPSSMEHKLLTIHYYIPNR